MKRLLLLIVALVIAVAPALADICRLDCERARQPECPLHQQAPHKCAHDHTVAAADVARTSLGVSRPLVVAIAVIPPHLDAAPIVTDLRDIECQHAPPLRSPHIDVLRI
jgi:hypothetical protein